jgi:hypothetical protein
MRRCRETQSRRRYRVKDGLPQAITRCLIVEDGRTAHVFVAARSLSRVSYRAEVTSSAPCTRVRVSTDLTLTTATSSVGLAVLETIAAGEG